MNERSFLVSLVSHPSLTTYDASILLLTRDPLLLSDAAKVSLLPKVRGASWDWINSVSLFEACLRILALHSADNSLIDGVCIGHLAKRLVQSEMQVGGPYSSDDHHTALATNALISQLFTQLGAPLPNLDLYIKKRLIRSRTLHFDKGEWTLIWPRRYTKPDSMPQLDATAQPSTMPPIIKAVLSLNHPPTSPIGHTKSSATNSVTASVQQNLLKLDTVIHPSALQVWKSVHMADKRNEISMISHYFVSSLVHQSVLPNSIPEQLGIANYYTWMAYTIYDDFIDDEGHKDQLPIANITHRQALQIYLEIAKNNEQSLRLINEIYNAMDAANSWELAHCRCNIVSGKIRVTDIPSYKTRHVLARRAYAHVLGPLLVLNIIAATAAQSGAVNLGLRHYLIARQINDDLHDWKQDLSHGHISFVVAYLLRKLRIPPGTYELQSLIVPMQNYFWKCGLEELCEITINHVKRATAYYTKSNLLQADTIFMRNTLDPIEQSARQSIATHNDQKNFLKIYKTDGDSPAR